MVFNRGPCYQFARECLASDLRARLRIVDLSLSLSLALRWQGTVVGGLTGVFSLHVAHTHKKNQSVGTLPRVEERARTGPEPGPFPDPGGSIARVPRNVFFLLPSSPRPLSLSRPRSHSSQGSKPCR